MIAYSAFLGGANDVAIFLFHGVIRERRWQVRNYTNKHLTQDRFVDVLKDLCAAGTPVSMQDVVDAHANGARLPRRPFVVTFDDGFENNYSVAAPVLADFKVPATFYLTTGFIESNSSSWIDMIEYAVERTPRVALQLRWPELSGVFESRGQKLSLLHQIRVAVKNDAAIDPYDFAREIWLQLGVKEMAPDAELDQKMSWAQAKALSRNSLFTIGGHSHTHRILEFLAQPELETEVSTSMDKLRANLDVTVTHYSYPEGMANCYSDRVIDLLQRQGIVCAPSAIHGLNKVEDDLFHLKRIMVV
jgi:peptidoglycan/xylan/chitin deacetylase (PgdA/CDA1 family)